jgi:hypothetical protein
MANVLEKQYSALQAHHAEGSSKNLGFALEIDTTKLAKVGSDIFVGGRCR